MEERELSSAFSDSLREDLIGSFSELAEIGLDNIMEDGILKEIPFFSTAISLYKIGNSVKDRYNLKKMAIFFDDLNRGISSEDKRIEYQRKIQADEKSRNQQIEYLYVLIDRYVSYEKPQMLSKLYLAYLDEKITWNEVVMYAEVIDRFVLLDYETLMHSSGEVVIQGNVGNESILRLIALGLMVDITNNSLFQEHGNGNFALTFNKLLQAKQNNRVYKRTEFGEKFVRILRG